jgi:hypothetical protein
MIKMKSVFYNFILLFIVFTFAGCNRHCTIIHYGTNGTVKEWKINETPYFTENCCSFYDSNGNHIWISGNYVVQQSNDEE